MPCANKRNTYTEPLKRNGSLLDGQFACIMFTDIVAYTTLIEQNEQLAMQVLAQNRNMQKSLIEYYGGQFVKEMGDGILSMFNSNRSAVSCAQDIQQATEQIDHLRLRIGIHSGQVFKIDGDVFGVVVNIASRLQTLARPGEIMISEDVARWVSSPNLKPKSNGFSKLKNLSSRIKTFIIDCRQERKVTPDDSRLLQVLWFKILNLFTSAQMMIRL